MKTSVYLIIWLLAAATATAQDKPQYAVAAIPDSLLKDVNSVIREESDILVIKQPGKAKQVVKRVITVLNVKAEDELEFQSYYDQFRKIDDIEINLYDANGKYIRRSR